MSMENPDSIVFREKLASGRAGAPGPVVRGLSAGQWFTLAAAFLGWLFDGFEIGLFPVVARPALLNLIAGGTDAEVGVWMARITAAFLLGAAAGGLIFGFMGDRLGRARALAASILCYSLCTGLGYFAQSPWQLGVFRFIAALGMGGEWALGVALVMECWPEKFRPALAGAIGAAANFGFLLTGVVAKIKPVTPESWRWMFLTGAAPALLVFLILLWVPESQKWKESVRGRPVRPVREVFSKGMRKRTLLAIVFASVALIGTWGSVQWLPLWADQLVKGANPAAKADTQMVQAFGAIAGCLIAPMLGAVMGRRMSYFLLSLASLVTCGVMFRWVHEMNAAFLILAFFVSAATAAFYGWFPLYFPELFPTRIRATGQGLCYNFGRIFAALGALVQGRLVEAFHGSYAQAGAIVTLVYLIGMVLIWFAPETKGKPLPE